MYKGLIEDIKRSEVLDRIINNDRSIKKTLLRRGYTYQSDKQNASKKLLMELPVIDRTPVDSFYQLMQEQSNRVILKKLCSLNHGFTKEQMQKNWAPEKIDSLLSRLQDLKRFCAELALRLENRVLFIPSCPPFDIYLFDNRKNTVFVIE